MRSNYSFNLLSQPERNQLRYRQMHSTSERNTKVNSKDLAISGVYQEVLQMSVSDSQQVGGCREDTHTLDELVLDSDKRRRG